MNDLHEGPASGGSSETQLIILIDDLLKNIQNKKRTYMCFSNASDKVAHENLVQKLHHYDIRGVILKWIKNFLNNKKQIFVIPIL